MAFIRPLQLVDEEGLIRLAFLAHAGITSLPKNREQLKGKLERSCKAFISAQTAPSHELFLFGLEEEGQLIGVSGIWSLAPPEKLYTIQKEAVIVVQVREPESEICALFLDPAYRKEGLGKLLSLSRFHFMRTFRKRFVNRVMAKMRGFILPNNYSPFWSAFGSLYDATPFEQIAEQHPIVTSTQPVPLSMIAQEAREVMGRVHPNTEPALAMLEREGFRKTNFFDLPDGGPILMADLKTLRTVQECVPLSSSHDGEAFLISNGQKDFRAVVASIHQGILDPHTREQLQLGWEDVAWISTL